MVTSSCKLVVFLAALLPLASAFAPAHPRPPVNSAALGQSRLTEIDEICVENVAQFCLDHVNDKLAEGCDVEEYEALVNQLQDQRATLVKHVEHIDALLERLQGKGAAATTSGAQETETYFAG